MTPMESVRYLVVHTEGSPSGAHGSLASIRRYHVVANGWEDVGYHYVIDREGRIHAGRSERFQGAGVAGFNRHALHVCVTGNADREAFNPPQLVALLEWIADARARHGVPLGNVLGHRECYAFPGVPNTGKSCPGRLTNMASIRALATDRWPVPVVADPPPPPPVAPPIVERAPVEPTPPFVPVRVPWWRRLSEMLFPRPR